MPTPEEVDTLKQYYPAIRDLPPDGTFEIGIMLAGAVSAGAYTAGVIDFLVEALDAWHKAKADDAKGGVHTVPQHKIVLRIISGASGGGMNGGILAAAMDLDFPHIYHETKYQKLKGGNAPPQHYAANPFYNAWVKSIDILPLLETGDLHRKPPPDPAQPQAKTPALYSVLDCDVLGGIAQQAVQAKGSPADPQARSWALNPLELRLTVTNLRGVLYAYNLRDDAGAHEGMRMHSDQMAFAIEHSGNGPKDSVRPDCLPLDTKASRDSDEWNVLANTAIGTGAFPLALKAQKLTRPNVDAYRWRGAYYDEQVGAVMLQPIWTAEEKASPYDFPCVDGGVANNEPFQIVHDALAGPRGSNPQHGPGAKRAILVIDPFVEDPKPGPADTPSLFKAAGAMLSGLIDQARITMQNLAQIQSDNIYSRYMISPVGEISGETFRGSAAIASGRMQGFSGFLCEAYREHDFLLGRRNAQRFLHEWFTVPAANPIAQDNRWSDGDKQKFKTEGGELQIVPLCGHLADIEETMPARPAGAYEKVRAAVEGALRARVAAVLKEFILNVVSVSSGSDAGAEQETWLGKAWGWLKTQGFDLADAGGSMALAPWLSSKVIGWIQTEVHMVENPPAGT